MEIAGVETNVRSNIKFNEGVEAERCYNDRNNSTIFLEGLFFRVYVYTTQGTVLCTCQKCGDDLWLWRGRLRWAVHVLHHTVGK